MDTHHTYTQQSSQSPMLTDYSSYVPGTAFLDDKKVRSNNLKAVKKTVTLTALSFLAVLALTNIFQIVAMFIVNAVRPELNSDYAFSILLASFSMYVVGMGGGYLILRLLKRQPLPQKKLKLAHWLIILVMCFGLMYTGSIIGNGITLFLNRFFEDMSQNPVQDLISELPLWAIVVSTVIAAPIFEELFFRKLLLDRLRVCGAVPALIISSVAFGLFHGNFSQLFYATMVGFAFGFIYLKTGRIRYTIALHMTVNFCGSVIPMKLLEFVSPVLEGLEGATENIDPALLTGDNLVRLAVYFAYALAIMTVWITGVVLILIHIKKYRLKNNALPLPGGKSSLAVTIVNPAMIVSLIIFALMIVSSIIPI